MATIIDGKAVSEEMRSAVKIEAEKIHSASKNSPALAIILVGNDENSARYVKLKNKACEEAGIKCHQYILPAKIEQDEVIELIEKLNENPDVNGILVQLPLPAGLNEDAVVSAVSVQKDVDGIHPENLGRLLTQSGHFFKPCTPAGCVELITRNIETLSSKHVVIVGRGLLTGRPLAALLMHRAEHLNCTVTVCNSYTKNLGSFTSQADVLVTAAGVPGLITGDMVKEGSVVIDVGISSIPPSSPEEKWRLSGDVVFDEVMLKAKAITPVPGGVGPMTITMLLVNIIEAWKLQHQEL